MNDLLRTALAEFLGGLAVVLVVATGRAVLRAFRSRTKREDLLTPVASTDEISLPR